jgi:hypothetical protein
VGRCTIALLAAVLALGGPVLPRPSEGVELLDGEDPFPTVSLDTALKCSSLISYAPDDPVLYPERWSAAGLFRLRLRLSATLSDWIDAELAYEQRMALVTEDAGAAAGSGILPGGGEAFWRLWQLDWQIAEDEPEFVWRHEIDRALVALHPTWGEVTVGRQAIGLGRGVLFGAVDMFSPFSPTEIDREWRRGVDAARVEHRITDTSSAEVIAVGGETWDDCALLGRVRGYTGEIDGELLFGKRAGDLMCGLTTSAVVGDAEVHGEAALFRTPEALPAGGLFGDEHLAAKAVLGASHTFGLGNGLTVLGEYHYSGFGLRDAEDATVWAAVPTYQERLLRGDMQILGRHALAAQSSYPLTETVTCALLVLLSPTDGSGQCSPSVVWDASEHVTVNGALFVPWGQGPSDGRLGSEYGSSPVSLFVQLSAYF